MSFTGIGRIGSQHTLTSPQDDDLYLFNGAMWCTHPLLAIAAFANGFDLVAGSKIVKSGGAGTDFTLLCQDIQTNNSPLNKYIAYYSNASYGVLEVDYVLNANTLILKYPAFETATVGAGKVSLIDYWNTPILKEVEVRPNLGGSSAVFSVANKYSTNAYALYDVPWTASNEGGVEPMLITATIDALTILKY